MLRLLIALVKVLSELFRRRPLLVLGIIAILVAVLLQRQSSTQISTATLNVSYQDKSLLQGIAA